MDPQTNDEPVDEQTGTEPDTGGDRDPLSTDDGLAEAADGMPEVEERDTPPGEDSQPTADRTAVDNPGLDVDDNGTDPLAGDDSAGGN